MDTLGTQKARIFPSVSIDSDTIIFLLRKSFLILKYNMATKVRLILTMNNAMVLKHPIPKTSVKKDTIFLTMLCTSMNVYVCKTEKTSTESKADHRLM